MLNQELEMETTFFGIEDTQLSYYSNYSGVIGLSPAEMSQPWNFLHQLKDKGLIDHEIISIYTNTGP